MMMNRVVNPYQSAQPAVDDRTRLAFDSTIQLSDYAALIPHRDSEVILVRILFGLVVLMSLGIATAIITSVAIRGWHNDVIPAGILSIVMMVGAVYLLRYTWSGRRARRHLKKYPDLLSPARGELTESGIAFHDGIRQHWFGPQYLVNAVASNDGVRVYVDQNPYRYLALTSRMFDGYNMAVAQRLKQGWCTASAQVTDTNEVVGLESWTARNPTPLDAITFVGTMTLTQPMRTREVRTNAIIESASIAAMLVMGVVENRGDHRWTGYALIGYALFALAFNIRRWWRYFRATAVHTWHQRGWVSPLELAILTGSRGLRMSLGEVGNYNERGSILEITTLGGSTYYIAREHVASDADWTRMLNQCRGILVSGTALAAGSGNTDG